MSEAPLEFCQVGERHQLGLARFFQALADHGDEHWFHPHPLTAHHAAQLAAYRGRDLYYVANSGDLVLAYGMLRGWDEGYEIPSLGLAVHPAWRSQGLARSFMLFLLTAARHRGAAKVRVKVGLDNVPSQRMCETAGFRFLPDADGRLLGLCVLRTPGHD